MAGKIETPVPPTTEREALFTLLRLVHRFEKETNRQIKELRREVNLLRGQRAKSGS